MSTPAPLHPTQKLLLGPGPCNPSPRVQAAQAMPMLGHLDAEFIRIVEETKAMLRLVMGTENAVTFPISGTGSAGMEFVLVNFIEPGTRALIVVNGVFGGRMANLAEKMGAAVTRVEFPWGTAADFATVAAKAEQVRPHFIGVVSGETSTGVYQNMEGWGDLARRHDALLAVDCVTSLAGMPVRLDAWGADLAYSGTQKCLACPPGLSPVTVSPRALERFAQRKSPVPSFYLDLAEIRKYVNQATPGGPPRSYHHTPPITMIYALHQSLCEVLEEGLETRWARHRDAAQFLIARLAPLGLVPLVAEADRLNPLTTFHLPPGDLPEAQIRARLLNEHHIEIGGGLGPLAGKIWRVGLMGPNATRTNVETLAACLESCLGYPSLPF